MVGFASWFNIYVHAIANCIVLVSRKLCLMTKRELLHAIHLGLQLGAPGEDMMAAQITNAQRSQRKYGRKHERKYGRNYERKYGRKHERKYRRKLDFVQRCETQD